MSNSAENQSYSHVRQHTDEPKGGIVHKSRESSAVGMVQMNTAHENVVVHYLDENQAHHHHEGGSSGYEEDEENDALNVSYYAREFSGRWFCFPRAPKSTERIFVLPIEEEGRKYSTKQYNKEWYGDHIGLSDAKSIARDATEINHESIQNLVGRSWLYQAVPEFFIGTALLAIIIFIIGDVDNLELVIPVTLAITILLLVIYFFVIRKYSTNLFLHSEARLSQYFSQINASEGQSSSVWVIGEYGLWVEFHVLEKKDATKDLELPEELDHSPVDDHDVNIDVAKHQNEYLFEIFYPPREQLRMECATSAKNNPKTQRQKSINNLIQSPTKGN